MPGFVRGGRDRGGENVRYGARIRSEIARARGEADGSFDPETVARILTPAALSEISIGGELVPTDNMELRDTVTNPDYVTLDASRDRLDMAHRANVLEIALDAADSIDARNSLEKMLAHQMAVLHKHAMKLAARLDDMDHRARPERLEIVERNVETCRLVGTISRLTATYAQAFQTLQRVRSNGRQTVIVQHVHVNAGGQAVVAGKVGKRRGRRRAAEVGREARQNEEQTQ